MHSPDKFTGCTLLIIPLTLYDAHSSLFPRQWLTITSIYTLLTKQRPQLWLCTLLINLMDAHSSFSTRFTLFPEMWLSIIRTYTLLSIHESLNFHYPLDWPIYWMHTPHHSIDFIWCTLLVIPKTVAEHNQHLHTPDKAQRPKLRLCTLLINLLDAHSSLFHWLYIMHTPHYSQGSRCI